MGVGGGGGGGLGGGRVIITNVHHTISTRRARMLSRFDHIIVEVENHFAKQ